MQGDRARCEDAVSTASEDADADANDNATTTTTTTNDVFANASAAAAYCVYVKAYNPSEALTTMVCGQYLSCITWATKMPNDNSDYHGHVSGSSHAQ